MSWIRARLTYANVMSTIAAFLALGGVSYAAATIPNNSVGSSQLRSGAVTLEKLNFPLALSGSAPQTASVRGGGCGGGASCPGPSPQPVAHTAVNLAKAGPVLVIANAALTNPAAGSITALDVSAWVDSTPLSAQTSGQVDPGSATTVPYVAYIPKVAAGKHTITLFVRGTGGLAVLSASTTLSALALP